MSEQTATICECPVAGFCARHGCDKPPYWHNLCRTRAEYFELWEQACGAVSSHQNLTGQVPSRAIRSNPVVSRKMRSRGQQGNHRLGTSVVVISQTAGHLLAECLEALFAQSASALEIVIVDMSKKGDALPIAEEFAARAVRYQRFLGSDLLDARRVGFELVSSEVTCFLDAADRLPPEYLTEGLKLFSNPSVGVVYSDVECPGAERERFQYPDRVDLAELERGGGIPARYLVRREALRLGRVFEDFVDPQTTDTEWFFWRRILSDGWIAVKQPACVQSSRANAYKAGAQREFRASYFDLAGLMHETVTLFIPLSGRSALWSALGDYLDRQTWPHEQISLILMDTSQQPQFSRQVRQWIARADYRDVRHLSLDVAQPGVADDNRHAAATLGEVRVAMARIYNRMAREARTGYVWVIEDDVIPPDNACERLLRGFDRDTVSVSGMYFSRYDGMPCAWDQDGNRFPEPAEGLQVAYGNGFGCVVLRGEVLRNTVFLVEGDYDRAFYRQMERAGWNAKVDWRVLCRHRSVSATAAQERKPTAGPTPNAGIDRAAFVGSRGNLGAGHAPGVELAAMRKHRACGPSLLRRKDLPKPWQNYSVTVCIPHLETPELLLTSVRLWELQHRRPFILVVDTGSTSAESSDAFSDLRGRPGIEVAELGILSAVEHLSDRVAIAMDYAFSRCPTELLLATHVDVFPKHRDLVNKYLPLCSASNPVVGWEMSPRGPGRDGLVRGTLSNGVPGHAFTLFHVPTMDRIGAGWSMRRAHHAFGLPRSYTHVDGWPDTEVCLGRTLAVAGVRPLFLGRELNAAAQETEDWIHVRSATVQLHTHRRIRDGGDAAYHDAIERVRQWEAGAETAVSDFE